MRVKGRISEVDLFVGNFRKALYEYLDTEGVTLQQSCLTCASFDEANETCRKHANQRPPARVIAFGCPDYFDLNEVPF
jgi:hypothetical protein